MHLFLQRLTKAPFLRGVFFVLFAIGIPALFVSIILFDPKLLLYLILDIIMTFGLFFFAVVLFSTAWEYFKKEEPFWLVLSIVSVGGLVVATLVYFLKIYLIEVTDLFL